MTPAEEAAAALAILVKHLPPDDARAGDYLKAIIGALTAAMNLRRALG